MARYFASKKYTISGFYSRSFKHATASASQINSQAFNRLAECIEASDWLFLTVPDDQIAVVWQEVEPLISEGQCVFHCSGAKSSAVFVTKKEIACFSLHPLMAFADKEIPASQLAEVPFTLEGSKNLAEVQQLLTNLGNPIATIAPEEKIRYHAACVFVSNLVVGLTATAEELLLDCGLSKEFAQTAWRQLFLQNAQNLLAMSPSEALTGPVERNDLSTVTDHLAALPREATGIYRELTKKLIQIATLKHPEREYQQMERELNQ